MSAKPPLHDRIRDALAHPIVEGAVLFEKSDAYKADRRAAVRAFAEGDKGEANLHMGKMHHAFNQVSVIAAEANEYLADLQEGYDEMVGNLHDLSVALDQEIEKQAQLSAAHEMLHGMANHVIAELDRHNKQRIVKMLAQRGNPQPLDEAIDHYRLVDRDDGEVLHQEPTLSALVDYYIETRASPHIREIDDIIDRRSAALRESRDRRLSVRPIIKTNTTTKGE